MVKKPFDKEKKIEKVERLAIAVSGLDISKLLAICELKTAHSLPQCKAIDNILEKWAFKHRIIGLCFDSTNSNTGEFGGVCILLERTMKRPLLQFACQHHIYEIVISEVFLTLVEKATAGPEISLFNRLQNYWNRIKILKTLKPE